MLPTNEPRSERESPGPASRLAGAVWGHLVGDAIGVPYEGRPADAVGDVVFGASGSHGQPAGTWSDDGALMLATLDATLQPGRFSVDPIARRMLAWYQEGAYTPDGDGRFDVGGTTRVALERLVEGIPALDAGPAGDRDGGNGSLMRMLPVALANRMADEGVLAQRAHQVSRITHGHPRCQVSCALYLLLVQRLVNWSRPSNAIFATQRTLKLIYMVSQTYAPQLAAFNELLAWKDRTGSGYVLDSFWSAWDAFADAAGYEETIRRAIAPGGDTDTTAAIAGSLAGAHWGWEAIPREWLRGMRGREIVTPLVDRLVEREAGVRTSTGSPLRVDPVDLAETSLAGAGGIGITFLPGKKLAGRTGPHWRDLDADVASLRGQGTGALLLLVEDGELESAMVQDLPDVVAAAGIDLVRFPIPDPRTPTDTPGFRSVIRALAGRIRSGERVVVACRGGLDRSGMAAACILREGGLEASPAMERVRVARSGALTREEQIHFVIDWVAGT